MNNKNPKTKTYPRRVDFVKPKYEQGDILRYEPIVHDPRYYHVLEVKVIEGPSYHYVYMDLHDGFIYETHMLNIDQYATVSKVQ